MNKLQEICEYKKGEIAKQKQRMPESELVRLLPQAPEIRSFKESLKNKTNEGKFALIAEIKKASPSKGLIREDFNPKEIAVAYEEGGAACISVLTDEKFFQGKSDYLAEVRSVCNLPLLRKDFMLDPYQVIEARVIGADCILIIMAAVSDIQAQEIEAAAADLGMDALIEVHDKTELERALRLQSRLIGINNRNLKTFEIDLKTTEDLVRLIPANTTGSDYHIVCESGISTHDDMIRISRSGVNTFLVGETLMRQENIEKATQELLGNLTIT